MSRWLYRGALGYALWAALWRWLEDRTVPLRVGTRIVTWAHGNGRFDDTPHIQRALDRGGSMQLPAARYRVLRRLAIRGHLRGG